jgi:hypothetical protein
VSEVTPLGPGKGSPSLGSTTGNVTKEKAGCWTHQTAFAHVRVGPNIQLLPYPLVSRHNQETRLLPGVDALPLARLLP